MGVVVILPTIRAVAAAAAREIEAGCVPNACPNLDKLIKWAGIEPTYDPLHEYRDGAESLRENALGLCKDLAQAA